MGGTTDHSSSSPKICFCSPLTLFLPSIGRVADGSGGGECVCGDPRAFVRDRVRVAPRKTTLGEGPSRRKTRRKKSHPDSTVRGGSLKFCRGEGVPYGNRNRGIFSVVVPHPKPSPLYSVPGTWVFRINPTSHRSVPTKNTPSILESPDSPGTEDLPSVSPEVPPLPETRQDLPVI